jgi:lipopolysaccharide biosynthesis regulator YciM
MSAYAPMLAALVALLAGLAIGKAWERYKLKDGNWIDRRRARESPHYILGLNFLVANQIDLAIEELSRAASLDAGALEVHMILGNLYREKGQVGKAITVHQSLLQRPKLSKLEHAYVLLCLGLDYKRGGFVERALEAFTEVLRLDPKNEYALLNLQKLHEEQHQWTEAYDTRQRLTKLTDTSGSRPQNEAILAFLENEIGLEAMRRENYAEAIRRFEAAIDLDARAVPAYLNLGDVRVRQGDEREAAAIWEKLIAVASDRAYLAFDRLEALAIRTGNPERFARLCRCLIEETPHDWRARLALSRHLAAAGQPRDALDLLFAALVQNPHALSIHQAIWRALGELHHPAALVDRYGELTQHAIFYLDPHVCMRCRYRSTELLWQCPHCHDWNTFVEERIAPAQDSTEVEV